MTLELLSELVWVDYCFGRSKGLDLIVKEDLYEIFGIVDLVLNLKEVVGEIKLDRLIVRSCWKVVLGAFFEVFEKLLVFEFLGQMVVLLVRGAP
jgi:hypothetical protein